MAKILAKFAKSEAFVGSTHSAETIIKRKARENLVGMYPNITCLWYWRLD